MPSRPSMSLRCFMIVAFANTTACHAWHASPESPTVAINQEQRDRVRLHLLDGATRVVLWEPRVQGDSILGLTQETLRGLTVREAVTVPADYVASVDVRAIDLGYTVLGIMATGLAAVGLFYAYASLALADGY